MGKQRDMSVKAPEFSATAVDRIDPELSLILEGLLPAGGQNVDR